MIAPPTPPTRQPGSPSPVAGGSALGDPDRWVDEHGDALMAFAVSRLGDRSVAEDLVQETLLAGWRTRSRFNATCSPRTWFVSILKRKIADHFREHGRRDFGKSPRVAEEPTHAGPTPEHSAVVSELWTHIGTCTSRLPAHLARILRLRTFADQPADAICRDEGISRRNLSVRLHRARRLLLECLERGGFGADAASR